MINIFLNLGLFAKIIILILILFSVISWGIIFSKWRLFRKLKKENEGIRRKLVYFKDFEEIKKYYDFKKKNYFFLLISILEEEKRDYQIKETIEELVDKAGKNLPFLATASSVSPFLGLLGTVWGITKVFFDVKDLPMITLQAIAPGMADALITTIAGLLVAIPAVIAYNYFIIRLEEFRKNLEKIVNYLIEVKDRK
ncbi:MAG: MotA/TolQ/ExbB proton channel family protein [candidate division WOR-3 bacterium]|nr:MotA/TolQ/ExbB proton channel family protein [candidate division WOR-3 bacterium]MCX7837181.1 MotA/TolQ/ExbB proton channel family protein [candidate division WOR-3 bacterium]MDW8114461.1 MotA/TolQ/ExbB proton channel family protein [candidate division WOR-3 bacterium]